MAVKTRRTPASRTEPDEALHVTEPASGVGDADGAGSGPACSAGGEAAAGAGGDVVEEEDTQRASYWIDRLSQGLPACSHCALDGPPSAPLK